jgi:rubrerythrin
LKRRVKADTETQADKAPPTAGRDPADPFQRLSRAIRLTLVLEARMAEDLRALIAGEVTAAETRRPQAADRAANCERRRREAKDATVRALVTQAILAEVDDYKVREQLRELLTEVLKDSEAHEGYADAPLRETVERLCADLRLTPDWSQWTEEGWALPLKRRRPAPVIFNQPGPITVRPGPAAAEPPRLE